MLKTQALPEVLEGFHRARDIVWSSGCNQYVEGGRPLGVGATFCCPGTRWHMGQNHNFKEDPFIYLFHLRLVPSQPLSLQKRCKVNQYVENKMAGNLRKNFSEYFSQIHLQKPKKTHHGDRSWFINWSWISKCQCLKSFTIKIGRKSIVCFRCNAEPYTTTTWLGQHRNGWGSISPCNHEVPTEWFLWKSLSLLA